MLPCRFPYKNSELIVLDWTPPNTPTPLPIFASMGLPSVLKSRSFKTPPTDGSLLIHQLVEWNAKNSPDHPVYVYDTPEGTTTAITWREAHRALQRAAHFVLSALRTFDIRGDPTSPPHVAIISNSRTISFCRTSALHSPGVDCRQCHVSSFHDGSDSLWLSAAPDLH